MCRCIGSITEKALKDVLWDTLVVMDHETSVSPIGEHDITDNPFVICRFKNGLQCLGVMDSILTYPSEWTTVFIPRTNSPLDPFQMDALFEIEWSEKRSNRHRQELLQ
jgi:hypothetical protein